jgi:hypothetical protein
MQRVNRRVYRVFCVGPKALTRPAPQPWRRHAACYLSRRALTRTTHPRHRPLLHASSSGTCGPTTDLPTSICLVTAAREMISSKSFAMVAPKELPGIFKRACAFRDFAFDLQCIRRNVSRLPTDVRHARQIWNNLFQEFHLLGDQADPGNSWDVRSGPCQARYETRLHRLPCARHDDRDGCCLLL